MAEQGQQKQEEVVVMGMIEGNEQEGDKEKWVKHYSSRHQMLLVGEGDFSFSLCLALGFGSASNMVATSLDTHKAVTKKYKKAKSNLGSLEKLGASVLHGVDATEMKLHPDLTMRMFDRIIFNFPHAGFHGKEDDNLLIEMHKSLVGSFLKNSSTMLRANGEVHISHKTSATFCRWNLEELAQQNSLALIEKIPFNIGDYPGYNNKRGDGNRCDEPFPLGKCSTFKFIFYRPARITSTVMSKGVLACQKSQQFQNGPVQVEHWRTLSDCRYLGTCFTPLDNDFSQYGYSPIGVNTGREGDGNFNWNSNYAFQACPIRMRPQSLIDRGLPGYRHSSFEISAGRVGTDGFSELFEDVLQTNSIRMQLLRSNSSDPKGSQQFQNDAYECAAFRWSRFGIGARREGSDAFDRDFNYVYQNSPIGMQHRLNSSDLTLSHPHSKLSMNGFGRYDGSASSLCYRRDGCQNFCGYPHHAALKACERAASRLDCFDGLAGGVPRLERYFDAGYSVGEAKGPDLRCMADDGSRRSMRSSLYIPGGSNLRSETLRRMVMVYGQAWEEERAA